jgi:hypothetical protein
MSHIGHSKLNKIHAAYAEVCMELLKGEPLVDANGTAVLDGEGKLIYLRPKANILKEIREFLKDNGIDQEPLNGSPLHTLSQLPTFHDEPLLLDTDALDSLPE